MIIYKHLYIAALQRSYLVNKLASPMSVSQSYCSQIAKVPEQMFSW